MLCIALATPLDARAQTGGPIAKPVETRTDAGTNDDCVVAPVPLEIDEAPDGPTVARRVVAGLLPTLYLSFGWRPRWALETGHAGLVHARQGRRRWVIGALWNPARLLRAAASNRRESVRPLPHTAPCLESSRESGRDRERPAVSSDTTDAPLERQLERTLESRYRRALQNSDALN